MNKKIYMKNRPFDEDDAKEMQDWSEQFVQNAIKNVYNSGIFQGLNVVPKSGLTITINTGQSFDGNNFFNVLSNIDVVLGTANATYGRYDLITIKYKSTTLNNVDTLNKYGYGTSFVYSQDIIDGYDIVVIPGTPAGAPVVPSLPAGSLALASVFVDKLSTSITAGNINDLRQLATVNQSINPVIIGKTAPLNKNVLWVDTN